MRGLRCSCCSVSKSCPTPHKPVDCNMPDSLSLAISWSLPKFASIELVMPPNHLILCHPLLLPSVYPRIRVFSNGEPFPSPGELPSPGIKPRSPALQADSSLAELQGKPSNESAVCIEWSKHWSFSFNITASNVYSELISFKTDWFDLLAVQETLKSLLQHQACMLILF